jgi:hypothetical protein
LSFGNCVIAPKQTEILVQSFIAFIVIISMIIPFSGSMMMLHYEKGRAKRHMMEMIAKREAGDIISLTFTNDEYASLKWEHDHEFVYNGDMYDLVEQELHGDSIILHCIHDKKETSINKSIVKFIAGFFHANPLHDQQLMAFTDFAKQLAPIVNFKPHIMTAFNTLLNVHEIRKSLLFFPADPIIPPPKYS